MKKGEERGREGRRRGEVRGSVGSGESPLLCVITELLCAILLPST